MSVLDSPHSFESWLGGRDQAREDAGPAWLVEARRQALERVRTLGIPSIKQEAWRYTGLKSLSETPFVLWGEDAKSVGAEDLGALLVPGLDAYRVVLVNGRYIPHLSDLDALPAGVRAGSLRAILEADADALEGLLDRIAGGSSQVFSALNTAALSDGFVLLADEGARVERPIELLHLSLGGDEPRVAQPRHLVRLGEGSKINLVERYLSPGESLYCTNSVLELILERGARLHHDRIQSESPNAFHITGLYLNQAQESRYQGVNLGFGASWARTDLAVNFTGEGAACELQGLYLAGDGQVIDYHLDIDHAVPGCASRELFKGILYGKGRAVFDGRVLVEAGAQKTDANLTNKNLLLSRNAEIDAKPQLEIFADDVKCSHGTTVGQIDPEMLFYLRSRGIAAPIARRMLCLGFAREIIEALGSHRLQEQVAEEVGRRLERTSLEKI